MGDLEPDRGLKGGTQAWRNQLLLRMYVQMFEDIKVHLQVVWQAVAVLASAFALFALVEKGVIHLDIAVSLILLIAAWLAAHALNASYWYNRNLHIIANIERQLLYQTDLRDVHYYYGKHRGNRMIDHLCIQLLFATGVGLGVLVYHFSVRVLLGIGQPWSNFETQRCVPYLFAFIAVVLVGYLRRRTNRKLAEFDRNSPGKMIDTTGIEYGIGHPVRQETADNADKQIDQKRSTSS